MRRKYFIRSYAYQPQVGQDALASHPTPLYRSKRKKKKGPTGEVKA